MLLRERERESSRSRYKHNPSTAREYTTLVRLELDTYVCRHARDTYAISDHILGDRLCWDHNLITYFPY